MEVLKAVGVGSMALGAFLVVNTLITVVNPDVTAADLGLLFLLVGALLLVSGPVGERTPLQGGGLITATITPRWLMLSVGLIVALAGLLLQNQTACSCPAGGLCDCGGVVYSLMLYVGLLVAACGALGVWQAHGPYLKKKAKVKKRREAPR